MALYEYRCSDCNTVFEELVSGSSTVPVACPSCASLKTEKIMSRIGGFSIGKSFSAPSCGAPAGACPNAASCGSGGCCSAT